jgi:transposase
VQRGLPIAGGLARGIELFQETGKSPHAIKEYRELNCLKKRVYSWLYEVSKRAPQEAFRDLERARRELFSGACRKEGKWVLPGFGRKDGTTGSG